MNNIRGDASLATQTDHHDDKRRGSRPVHLPRFSINLDKADARPPAAATADDRSDQPPGGNLAPPPQPIGKPGQPNIGLPADAVRRAPQEAAIPQAPSNQRPDLARGPGLVATPEQAEREPAGQSADPGATDQVLHEAWQSLWIAAQLLPREPSGSHTLAEPMESDTTAWLGGETSMARPAAVVEQGPAPLPVDSQGDGRPNDCAVMPDLPGLCQTEAFDTPMNVASLALQLPPGDDDGIFEVSMPNGETLGVVVNNQQSLVSYLLSPHTEALSSRLRGYQMELEGHVMQRIRRPVKITVL